jgi:hypothetical protein
MEERSVPGTAANQVGAPGMRVRIVPFELEKSLTMCRTEADVNPPATVPKITGADTQSQLPVALAATFHSCSRWQFLEDQCRLRRRSGPPLLSMIGHGPSGSCGVVIAGPDYHARRPAVSGQIPTSPKQREREAFVYRRDFPVRADKAVRARSIRGRMALDGLYVPQNAGWLSELRSELLSFPAGKHDDCVDALGLIGQLLDRISVGNKPAPPTKAKYDNGYRPWKPAGRLDEWITY